jgi:O-antigen ligase
MCLLLMCVAMMAGWGVGKKEHYASVGVFNNRNDFAHGIAMTLPVAAAFLLSGGAFLKILGVGMMAVVIPELVKSGSRGGQLAAIFAIYAVLVVRAKKARTRTLMLVLGGLAVMSAFAMSERLASVASYQTDESSMGRIQIWSVCLRSFRTTPFNTVMGRGHNAITKGMWRSKAAHSGYMNNLYELGLPGFAVFIGLLLFAARDAYAITGKGTHPTTRMLALALTGVMAGVIVGSGVESLSYRIYVLVPIAMVSSMRIIEQRERAAALSRQTSAGASPPADAFLHPVATPGFGLAERGLISRRDVKLVAKWTFACWLAYTVLVTVS